MNSVSHSLFSVHTKKKPHSSLQAAQVTVQTGCSEVPEHGRKHHLHRKTQVLSVSFKKAKAFLISQGRTCNAFLTKMDALLPVNEL